MKYLVYILVGLITVLSVSCEKVIPWKTEKMPVMLVVEGSFTNEYKKQQVKLSLSEDYFYNKLTPKVSGATVTVSDGTGIFGFTENPAGSGIYETDDSVAGEPGKTYTLNIDLKEPVNNTTHYYASGRLIPGITLDSVVAYIYRNPIYNSFSDQDSLLTIIVAFGQDPPQTENYYELNLYDNHTLINDTIDKVSVVDDKEGFNGQYVNSFIFFKQFDPGDTVGFEIISIGKDYYDFVNSTKDLADQSFDPFDMSGPPANAVGNIEGADAIGFFSVGYVSKGTAVAQYLDE